ncbi:restriction endonuclease subunit S [Trichocoleus sp. FACHB-832]|uniref:restriction endonuclease subunit S n=1 Tax=Trichocoleus sp. FACHB-832 TaxID=2692875 RepID=UPI001686CB36|nr:restriction endonuclease subunit S [Trichocoleus sp. FACHB-832]MBD1906446.1 restriction endonuclease subunit S [Trichocoleus sp. FACHB-832]
MTKQTLDTGWQIVRLGDVVEKTEYKEKNIVSAGLTRFLKVEHLDPDSLKIKRWGIIGEEELPPTFYKVFRRRQVLFPTRNPHLRRTAYADFDGICGEKTLTLQQKGEQLVPEFLPFIFQSETFIEHAVKCAIGSTNKHVRWPDLAAYEFAMPPVEEQKRISNLLLAIDRNTDALHEMSVTTRALWRSISAQEFSKGTDPLEELLNNHFSIISGQVNPTDDSYADLPLIAPNHIEGETGEILKLESARKQGAISGKYLFDVGSVLYSKIRPNLVKATIAPCKGLCSADMYALSPKASIRKEYLLEILLSDRFTQFAISGSMRTGIPKLNRVHLATYKARIPSLKEQDSYLEKALSTRQARNDILMRIEANKELKKIVLQKMQG